MSIGQLDWMAGEAVRGYGDIIPSALPGVRNMVVKQGMGVAGIVSALVCLSARQRAHVTRDRSRRGSELFRYSSHYFQTG